MARDEECRLISVLSKGGSQQGPSFFALLTGYIMEGGIDMTYKQIEASREARLWLAQIVLPIATVIMMVPEAREAVVDKVKAAKKNIETRFTKK